MPDAKVMSDAVMSDAKSMSAESFCDFYRTHLPLVYGYLLRLCAGDTVEAEDLTQDVWFALADELNHGRIERADVRWLITVARSRFIDHARRERLVRSKMPLLGKLDQHLTKLAHSWTTSTPPDGRSTSPSRSR